MNRVLSIFVVILFGSLLVGGAVSAQDDSAAVEPTYESIHPMAYEWYVNGLLYGEMGDHTQSAVLFGRAFDIYPHSEAIGYEYAQSVFRLQDPQKAVEIIDQVGSASPEMLNLKAFAYRALGEPDSAKAAYVELIQEEPRNQQAWLYLIGSFREAQDLDSTLWAYESLFATGATDYRLMNEYAYMLQIAGRNDEAAEIYRQSLEIRNDDENLPALNSLGEIYLSEDKSDSAEALFQRAVEVSPLSIQGHHNLSRIYFAAEQYDSALPHIKAVAELTPENPDSQRRLGTMYFILDSLTQSDSVFTSLVNRGDNNPANHFYLGRIAYINQEYEQARDEFIVLTKLQSEVVDSWTDLGAAYRKLNDLDGEISAYNTGLNHMQSEQDAVKLLFQMGAALDQSGDLDSCIAIFENILEHQPDHHQSMNYLGYTLADHNIRLDEARELVKKALSYEPDNAAYLDSYGWVFYRLGKYRTALKYLKRAAENSKDPVVLDHVGDALYSLGKLEDAREWWQKALEIQPDNQEIKDKLAQ